MTEGNELDSTCGISDEELTERFKESITIDQEICKVKGLPIAGYDDELDSLYIEYLIEGEYIQMKNRLPEVIVFAGPNGSGKTTITRMAKTVGVYINADDIKKSNSCSDLEAVLKDEELRESMVNQNKDFTFETVLSTVEILNC